MFLRQGENTLIDPKHLLILYPTYTKKKSSSSTLQKNVQPKPLALND